jgi:DNA mismatch repair ATPase MutS
MELLLKAKEMLTEIATEMSEFANKVSWLDVFVSQAILAYEKKYIKPDLNQSY